MNPGRPLLRLGGCATFPPMRVALLLTAVLLVACRTPRTVPVPDTGRDTTAASARTHDLEQRVARLEVQRLEKDAQVDQLQAQLDAARLEVVRAMAKIQSLASRAEAASAMAEAEVALQSLQIPAGVTPPGIAEARRLLSQASDEFNKGNYGGALDRKSVVSGKSVDLGGR